MSRYYGGKEANMVEKGVRKLREQGGVGRDYVRVHSHSRNHELVATIMR